MNLVVNETSFEPPAPDTQTLEDWLYELAEIVIKAWKIDTKITVFISDKLLTKDLASGIILWEACNKLQNSGRVEREKIQVFRRLLVNPPYWNWQPKVTNFTSSKEFMYDGIKVEELGVSYFLNSIAVSVLSHPRWEPSHFAINVSTLDESEDSILEEPPIKICHASKLIHLDDHIQCEIQKIQDSIQDGNDLWNRKEELFSKLSFCDDVQVQLQNLGENDPMWPYVKKVIIDLNDYCQTWQDEAFNAAKIELTISPESESTLNNKKYRDQRTFKCPDGEKRLFSLHVKISFKGWRIYFIPDSNQKKIIIGYVGKHSNDGDL